MRRPWRRCRGRGAGERFAWRVGRRGRAVDALTSGQLFAAGLDVFRSEPDYDMRFAKLDNVIMSPHIGSGSVETRNAMGFRALDNIAGCWRGRDRSIRCGCEVT